MAVPASNQLMYFDIETVPGTEKLENMPESIQKLWELKHAQFLSRNPDRYPPETTFEESFSGNAGIFAEFGKVVCISVGYIDEKHDGKFKVKSYAGDDEKIVLLAFADALIKWGRNPKRSLCGHNIKEFDVPFVARRMIIHNIPLPDIIQVSGKKPWEINFVDTLEAWKFGDYKHYTSLNLLSAVLGIPSPKDDIDGSQVGDVYYKEKNLDRIVTYCEKDVVTTARVLLRLRGENSIKDEDVVKIY